MNCAGYVRRNSSAFCQGAPRRANGIDPESYQASITSGTRRASPPPSRQGRVTSSPWGGGGARPASSLTSASGPAQVRCCSPHSQIGRGVPQYLVRDSAQSTLLRSHSPYRPSLMVGGCQLVRSFSASIRSLTWVVRMYQDGSA